MKKGISLIVLVITIIVMIILAASVVITLSNTGVINRASEAVDATNESQVQDLAALIWADAFMDNKRGTDLVNEVTTKLSEQGITSDKWNVTVTDTGVSIISKNAKRGLGTIITADDYGKTVDYTVTVDGIVYDNWQIYYHNSEYVYLVSKKYINGITLPTVPDELTSEEKALYKKFQVGNWEKAETPMLASVLVKDYTEFANTAKYGSYVVGSIGSPTLELLACGWNAKGYTPTIELTYDSRYGWYGIGEGFDQVSVRDDVYIVSDYILVAPEGSYSDGMYNEIYWAAGSGYGGIYGDGVGYPLGIRPTVCLKASIPATVGTTTDFSLIN